MPDERAPSARDGRRDFLPEAERLAVGLDHDRVAWIEQRVAAHAPRPSKDSFVRAHLLLAAHQLYFLERVPAFAAVDGAVDAVRRVRGPKVAGFVNAVLRRLAQEAAVKKPRPEDAFAASVPSWLGAALSRSLGGEETRRFLAASAVASLRAVSVSRACPSRSASLVAVGKTSFVDCDMLT